MAKDPTKQKKQSGIPTGNAGERSLTRMGEALRPVDCAIGQRIVVSTTGSIVTWFFLMEHLGLAGTGHCLLAEGLLRLVGFVGVLCGPKGQGSLSGYRDRSRGLLLAPGIALALPCRIETLQCKRPIDSSGEARR